MEEKSRIENVFDVGTWLGRKQAFGVMAGRCSAADAECLIEIKDKELYLELEPTWEDFCVNRMGTSRATADRAIRQYNQLGPNFAKLNSFARIKPAEFRRIAAAISDEGVCYGGEIIPMEPDNLAKLAQAVEALRKDSLPEATSVDAVAATFTKAERSLETALTEFGRLQDMDLDSTARMKLQSTLETGRNQLARILMSTAF
jgi:hypothetical protein